MRHHNSVFHSIQKHVPWGVFDRLVDEHEADFRVRRLPAKSQFLALLFAQLAGATSLREIEAGMASQSARLYHLGARCPARSTLADANAKRPCALFGDLFAHMAARASRQTRTHMADAVRILDATGIKLSSLSGDWLGRHDGHWAAKLHLVYDPRADAPLEVAFSDQNVNDITPAKAMTLVPGMTYVFDLAYYDFAWWAELDAQGCRFVCRLKSHTTLQAATEPPRPESRAASGGTGGDILGDRIGLLPRRLKANRKPPYDDPVREITVRISTGKIIRVVTNDLDAPADEIADLYKQRWQIELFFKWLKQNLKIRHFLGASENAVRIQVYVALIAYILLRLAKATQKAVPQPLAFARLVRLNLMQRRPIDALNRPPPQPPIDHRQMALQLEGG